MRHRKRKFKLNRFSSWRKSTIISLTRNLLIKQRIITTKQKAKATSHLTEKLISLAKKDSLYSARRAYQILGDHRLVKRLFKEIAPLFNHRASGFTRILSWVRRRGDDAPLVILELTEQKEKIKKPKKEKKKEPEEKERPRPKTIEEKPPLEKKPTKKFLGGLRKIFKKERDAL